MSRGAYRRAGGLNGRRVAAPPKRSHSQSDSSSGLQGWVVVSSTASSGVRGGLGPAETQLHTPRPQPRRLRQKEPLPGVCQSNIRVSATSTGWGPLRARHRLVPGTEDNECTSACLPACQPAFLPDSFSPLSRGARQMHDTVQRCRAFTGRPACQKLPIRLLHGQGGLHSPCPDSGLHRSQLSQSLRGPQHHEEQRAAACSAHAWAQSPGAARRKLPVCESVTGCWRHQPSLEV